MYKVKVTFNSTSAAQFYERPPLSVLQHVEGSAQTTLSFLPRARCEVEAPFRA